MHNNNGTVGNWVFYLARAKSYKEDNWGDQVSFVQESVKRGRECVKLKNLHC
jgi:hypothetical protein